ncbi:copper chaperone PCu(A)C [Colwellia asteriadis]|uniref:Copper chaperone PCu(A)C n=1 Tax=Colwellia asteriadis TaxID=517723 RepID=A0ABN1L3I0_9GAMM
MKKINGFMSVTVAIVLLLLSGFKCSAAEIDAINVTDGYVRASIPGTAISSAYMTLANNSENKVTLVGVSSKISPRIELHQHSMDDGMMRMRQIVQIDINANSSIVLKPHGLHLMIFDLTEQLTPETKVDITLHFSNDQQLTIQLPVKALK